MLKFKYFLFLILYIYIILPNYIISNNNLKNKNEEFCFDVTLLEKNSEEKSEIIYKAGETINLILKYNKYNETCFVRIEDFELLINNLTQHDDFDMNMTYNGDNIEIELNFTKSGEYQVQINYNHEKLNNYLGIKLITIEPNDCVGDDPEVEIVYIDHRDTPIFFVGENINMKIKCKDMYGNYIINQGNEQFKSLIYDSFENDIPNTINFQRDISDITKSFYLNNFKVYEPGKYNINIYLNSSIYFSYNLSINDNKCKENEYQCLNKSCYLNTNELYECNKNFLNKIEINKSLICDDESSLKDGKVFRCVTNDECVLDLNDCDCSIGYSKCNGQCIKDELNYCKINIPNNCNNDSLTLCPDGSCISEKECDFKLTCPFGFKSCGMKCIFYNETCSIENNCNNDFVLCWDFTCAISYDKCPSRIKCKKDHFLCPDGTCTNNVNNCTIPIERTCSDDYPLRCNDGTCVSSLENCRKNIVCPKGKYLCENNQCLENCDKINECKDYKCNNGLCVKNFFLCSNDIYCPNTYVKCEQGGCAKTIKDCDYIQGNKLITCPLDYDILCPDLSCVKSFEDCISKTPECPPSFPYLCWNNECRKNISECPTKITCPPSEPVLCNDGTCQKNKYYCNIADINLAKRKCNKDQFRCYDGSCVDSLRFCPTYSTCGRPEENTIKCWNGGCSNDINSCPEIPKDICLNNTEYPYLCPDGTCRESASSCSSISTCPDESPIKCYDNSCRDSLSSCPKFYECSENTIPCPDGTCASNIYECNTIVTCILSKPFLCFDGTCQKNLKDCPKTPDCGNNFLCPSGECLNHRQNCKNINICTKTVPVKCDSNVCQENINACQSISLECPSGYIKCLNGECKIKESLCEEYICPPNKPHKCIEGTCVLNSNYCNKGNGCPYFYPYKCKDGTCAKNKDYCKEHESFECPEKKVKCPDGSCQNSKEECPLQNGCSILKPIKCADGSCINPNSEECPKPKCGILNPFKCPNGYCVSDSAICSLSVKNDDIKDCGDSNLVMCNDGYCVPSYDYCLPQISCESGYSLCPDGTCRVSLDACPVGNNCPPERPFRCMLNLCVEKEEDCNYLICPESYRRCHFTGECYSNSEDCKNFLYENGCQNYYENGTKIETKRLFRCSDGRCLENEKQCSEYSIACYNNEENKFYLSNNGECVGSLNEILTKNNNCLDENKEKCPDGHCVDKQSNFDEVCFNEIGCPLIKPYRCSNNECVSSFNECPVHQLCDSSKPYLCGDGSCVYNYAFCNVLYPCDENEERCEFNKYCVDKNKKNNLCISIKNLCPQASPIKCPNGACVKDILSCAETQNKPTCNEDEFFCETLHKCLSDKIECIGENRVLNKNNNNNNYNNGCPSSSPYICYDGTCVSDIKLCPILPSCKIGKYRCENGICVDSLEKCNNLLKLSSSDTCPPGQTKCIDGICRNNCNDVQYLGCNVNEFHCSNGMCVKDILECIGYSMCDNIYSPFRCMDGSTCVNDISNCDIIYRQGKIYPINYSFNIYNSIDIDFIFDLNNKIIGKIHFDGNSLKIKNSYNINYGILKITQISDNFIKNNEKLYNTSSSFMFNITNTIPYSEGKLTYENSILSAIFNISSDSIQNEFRLPGLLTIKHNYYISDELLPEDYCLAKLKNSFDLNAENNHWICVDRQKTLEQITYKIDSLGIYAVILNPIRAKEKIDSKNFYVEHFQGIFLSILITISIGGIIFYIFSRLIRFREKYKETQKKIKMLKLLQEEYERMTTDVFGQTLGDNILGLVYTKNPTFMLNENDVKNNDTKLEEEVELLIKKCKKLEGQNNNIQKNIKEINEKYNLLKFEIDTINDS